MSQAAAEQANDDGLITCPYCGDNVPALVPIETGMRLRLQDTGAASEVPEAVCDGCVKVLSKNISKGAALRAEQVAKEQNRIMLWRNRVNLVKQAKQQLSMKNYADAAVAYEKYLKVLEIVYEVGAGELSPENFKKEQRTQELTVIASVYWDLMRVYDTHPTYRERQMRAAEKLAEFVRFTPVYPHIIRRAESNVRTSKNPEAFKKFLRLSNANRPRCFIATSAFEFRSPEVDALCRFRDQYLRNRNFGRRLIRVYYRLSPSVASWLDRHPALKPAARKLLTWVAESNFVRNRLNP